MTRLCSKTLSYYILFFEYTTHEKSSAPNRFHLAF